MHRLKKNRSETTGDESVKKGRPCLCFEKIPSAVKQHGTKTHRQTMIIARDTEAIRQILRPMYQPGQE